METKIGYKVVTREWRSVCGIGSLAVNYSKGEITRPLIPGSKLFIFDTLEHAREFECGSAILFCEYEPWNCKLVAIPNTSLSLTRYVAESFWKRVSSYEFNELETKDGMFVPKGTVLANWIKPIAWVESKYLT